MNTDNIIAITLTLLSVIATCLGYFVRGIMQRIDKLEEQVTHKVTSEEVRLLMLDKIDPIQKSLEDIQTTQQLILSQLIQSGSKK